MGSTVSSEGLESEQKADKNPLFEVVDVTTPFENIALALSGGGFRASAYCLGVLSYLNELEFSDHTIPNNNSTTLLQKVKYISSASGGSITNAFYTLCTAQGKSFDTFYFEFNKFLEGDAVLQRALSILNDEDIATNHSNKSKNIINSFALAYNEKPLFNDALLKDLKNPNIHIEEVCFNSTEFYKGIVFRQTVNLKNQAKGRYGNGFIIVSSDTAERLKIADVIAASSCFPAGFEPIIFPNDFTYAKTHAGYELTLDELKKGVKIRRQNNSQEQIDFANNKTFGLMDGGITDNQGLDTLMVADTRRIKSNSKEKRFDLIIVNDVGSHFMRPFTKTKSVPNADILIGDIISKGKAFNVICIVTSVLSFIGIIIFSLLKIECPLFKYTLIAIPSMFLGVSLFLVIIYACVKSFFKSDKRDIIYKLISEFKLNRNFSTEILSLLVSYFNKTKISTVAQLIKERVDSVLTLNNEVFLKHIRRILFKQFYTMPAWLDRRIGNHIYDLSETNKSARESQIGREYSTDEKNILVPSESIMQVAENAFTMPTTLWFDNTHTNESKLKDIIASGQFTTCFNLIRYIIKLKQSKSYQNLTDIGYKKRIDDLYIQLLEDWDNLKSNPHYIQNKVENRLLLSRT